MCFFSSDSKSHGICKMLFGARLAKTLAFTQFSACCKKNFFHAKGTKTLYYSVLALHKHKKTAKSVPKWTSKKHLVILSYFFPAPDPAKSENNTRVKDFGRGRRQRRAPG